MNDTTFQANGKIDYVPVVVNAKMTKQSNADRIRAMSDEELAQFIWNRDIDIVEKASVAGRFTFTVDREKCFKNVLDWLKAEVEE